MQYVPNAAKYMSTLLLHPGGYGSLPLAGFPQDRWLRRKAHIVFALEAMVVLGGDSPKRHTNAYKHTPNPLSFPADDLSEFLFQIQTLKRRETEKRNNLCVNSLIHHCSNAATHSTESGNLSPTAFIRI